ncbi:MAG: aldo/keto reductase [Armatimonadetes bacterium]|jgi:L-galactose dehydrogenase|nr:aldo/keto reductase [Armatimonadota bacterium]
MRYRQLGRTGLQVSELSYGAARGATEDPAQFIATVHAAIEHGINFIDTATGYDGGDSERVLGEALQGHDEVFVETKYCPYESYAVGAKYVGTPEALLASAEESLRRLRRDHLDVFLGHGIRTLESFERFMNDGCYDAMVKLRDQGKVRFLGISELSEGDGTHQVLQRAVPTGTFDVVMLTLNFMLQTAADSVLPLCRQHNVGTVVMMPLNQASRQSGLVSLPAALELVRRHIAAGNLPDQPPYHDPDLLAFLEPYPVPEAALRFVLAHDVSTCCAGTRSPERLQANLRAIDPPYLDSVRLQRLRELFGGIQRQAF